MIALDLDPYTAAHVAIALRRHRNSLLSTGRPCPAGLQVIEEIATKAAKGEQQGTDGPDSLDALAELLQAESVNRRTPLAPGEAAALLGISVKTIRRDIASGSLPSVPVGKRRHIPRDAIEALLVANRKDTK